jgi:pectate lyase
VKVRRLHSACLLAGVIGLGCKSSGALPIDAGSGIAGTTGAAGSGAGEGGGGAGAANAGGPGGDAGGPGGYAGAAAPDAGRDAPDLTPMPGVLIIQEDETGFSAVDGKVFPRQGPANVTGYTGTGFADGDPGMGKTISWSVKAEAAVTASFVWRYAFGGAATNLRDAALIVNGQIAAATVTFAYTNTWNDWQETPGLEVALPAGPSFIQLQALGPGGLANIDYFKVTAPGITPDTPRFTLAASADNPATGTVSVAPMQAFYPYGAMVTVTATANPGWSFQSWTGDVPGATAAHTFAMTRNTTLVARFLPAGTTQVPGVIGYATVQDDAGTPYLLTGGSTGMAVTATTIDELKMYLGSPEPYVVSFSGHVIGPDAVRIASNKTLLGVGTAHFQGVGLVINGSRNVIIRNVTVSHVVADGAGLVNDAIEITGAAKNIWIDHCDLYSDLDHGEDHYDGLLDVKNASSFITISWTTVHHHFKSILISSGDEQVGDAAIRISFHHNYFHDCGSRLPSIRFGKAHIFGNYYKNNTSGSCVNSRMGAVVRVENNFFETSKNPVVFADSLMTGYWEVVNNVYQSCTGSQPTTSTGQLTPPYQYPADTPADLPTVVPAGAGVGKI